MMSPLISRRFGKAHLKLGVTAWGLPDKADSVKSLDPLTGQPLAFPKASHASLPLAQPESIGGAVVLRNIGIPVRSLVLGGSLQPAGKPNLPEIGLPREPLSTRKTS